MRDRLIVQMLILGLLFCLQLLTLPVEAKQLLLRPLNARRIESILRQHDIEHDMMEGRSISSGFAALSGFTLGLTKALTGVLIYDVITANITESSVSENSEGTAQEICFNTRGARNLDDHKILNSKFQSRHRSARRRIHVGKGRNKRKERQRYNDPVSSVFGGTRYDGAEEIEKGRQTGGTSTVTGTGTGLGTTITASGAETNSLTCIVLLKNQ